MLVVIVIGVDCAIKITTGLAVVALEVNEEAKVMFVVTPVSALAAATASRSEQFELPLELMFGSTQWLAVPLPLDGSVFTVTTYAGATNWAGPVNVPVATPLSATEIGAVSAAVSVIVTVIRLPLTFGVPKLTVPLVELKAAVAPLMPLPPASSNVAVTVTLLPATAGLGETATVELTVETGVPVTLKLPLVAVRLMELVTASVADKVSPVSAGLMLKPEKLACPAVAPAVVEVLCVVVPLSVPAAADIATLAEPAVSAVPSSLNVTTGVGLKEAPTNVFPGEVVNASAYSVCTAPAS